MKMKDTLKYFALAALIAGAAACADDDELETTDAGPVMTVVSYSENAIMGDSVRFEVTLEDPIALSTLKGELYYDEDKVSDVEIRTKTNGTYKGAVAVPLLQNTPDGVATFRLLGQNIRFGLTTKELEVAVARPNPEYLTFVTEEKEYRAERTEDYTYELTAELPQAVSGYFETPALGEAGTVLTSDWDSAGKALAFGATDPIPYTSLSAGEWTITVNLKTFETAPFLVPVKLGDTYMEAVDDGYALVADMTNGSTYAVEGIDGIGEYTADADYFTLDGTTLKLAAPTGSYRTVVDTKNKFIYAEVWKDGAAASLQSDGTGAVWIIGEKVGKPTLDNEVGWNTEKALCMVPVETGKFRITLVAGTSVGTDAVNFKFYGGAHSWNDEFKHDRLTTTSDLVGIGTGEVDETGEKHDDGNLYIRPGKALEEGKTYLFTIDVTAGSDKAVLTVEEQSDAPADDDPYLVEIERVDETTLAATLNLVQGKKIRLAGIDLAGWWIDDNFLASEADGTLAVKVVDGKYRLTAKTDKKQVFVQPVDADGSDPTVGDDGTGGIWLMGWGVGAPSQDYQFGFTEGAAYCMAEISPAVYRLTGKAGPEKGSAAGDYFRYDYISLKYFHQNGWGGEMKSPTLASGTEKLLKDSGNLELADGVQLEEGATYQLTIDLTAGKDQGVVSFVKL